jgi:coenzyme F420-reducing hydrogenase delta subunit/NAD-dependent dihydropyrimidine dehydrogenase PreA subunit
MKSNRELEPVVVAFLCNWCGYAAADLAGVSRLQYPPNIRIIRVPCTGEIDIAHILRAFEDGIDGVFIAGCLKEQCHYIDGNYKAEERISFTKALLKAIGFEEKRLEMFFISASMGTTFAETAQSFVERIGKLGPSLSENSGLPAYREGEKRIFLIEQIKRLSKKKDVDFVVEGIEGFGKVELDREKCTGCGSCGNICEPAAIKINDVDSRRIISYTQGYCSACKKCEEQCEEEAIKVSEVFDLQKILSLQEESLSEVELLPCSSCGTMFAPGKQVVGLEEELHESLAVCPDCRSKSKVAKIHKMSLLGL